MMGTYKTLPEDAGVPEVKRLFGEILSDAQVHLLVQVSSSNAGFPVLRYKFAGRLSTCASMVSLWLYLISCFVNLLVE